MLLKVRNVEYFYVRIQDSSEKAYELLARLASEEAIYWRLAQSRTAPTTLS